MRKNGRRPKPLHAASGSELEEISKPPMVSINSGKIAYVKKKITPPTLPLSSIRVKVGIKAKQDGKPIPNEKPHKTSNIVIPCSPNLGRTAENNDEITPNRTQRSKKRILETLSAIKGPIRKDTTVAAGSNHRRGKSQAIVSEKSMVKNQVIELKIRKKIRKNWLR